MREKKTLQPIDPAALDAASGGAPERRAPQRRWQTAEGRAQIGDEYAECMTSATRGWARRTWDWAVAGVTGGWSDQRTVRDCADDYKKSMDIPR